MLLENKTFVFCQVVLTTAELRSSVGKSTFKNIDSLFYKDAWFEKCFLVSVQCKQHGKLILDFLFSYLRCFEKTARGYSKGSQDHVQRNECKDNAEGHIDILCTVSLLCSCFFLRKPFYV